MGRHHPLGYYFFIRDSQRQGGGDVCGQQSAKKGEEGKRAADTRRDAETARKVERGPWGSARRAGGGSRGPRGYQSGQTRLDRPWFGQPALSSFSRWDARSASGGPRLRRVPGGSPPPPPPPGGGRLGKSSRGCARPLSWGILPSVGLWKGPRAGSACPHPISSPSVPRRATESPGAEVSLI